MSRNTLHVSRITYYSLALVFFTLGLMSKPMLVTLPFVLPLLDYWPLRRFELSSIKTRLPLLLLEKVPFFVLAGVFSWITIRFQGAEGGVESLSQISLGERLSTSIPSYLQYIGKLFWPTRLAVVYPHPACHFPVADPWPAWQVWVAAFLLLAVSVFCLCQLRRRPYLAVGWFWYVGTMVPVIGLVQIGGRAMADRYTYIPMLGFTVSFVWFVSELCQSSVWRKVALAAVSIVALVACAIVSRHQLGYWRDSITLFAHAIEVTPDNAVAQCNLGYGLVMEGKPRWAAVHYRAALAINPRYKQAHFNLGAVLVYLEQWPEATREYETVLALDPKMSRAHVALTEILPHLNRTPEAVAQMEAALRATVDVPPETLNDLAWLLATSPRAEVRDGAHAVRFAELACELTHHQQTVMVGTLAAAYAEAGRFTEAVATAEKACALAGQAGDQALLARNQELLGLYRLGRAYHEHQ